MQSFLCEEILASEKEIKITLQVEEWKCREFDWRKKNKYILKIKKYYKSRKKLWSVKKFWILIELEDEFGEFFQNFFPNFSRMHFIFIYFLRWLLSTCRLVCLPVSPVFLGALRLRFSFYRSVPVPIRPF